MRCQEVETTQHSSTGKWTQNNRDVPGQRDTGETAVDTHDNIDKSQNNEVQQRRQDKRECMLWVALTYSSRNCKVILLTETGFMAACGQEWGRHRCKGGKTRDWEEDLMVMDMFSTWIVVMVAL